MEPVVNPYGPNAKLAAYQSVSVHGGLANADPHAMVLMLMDAALERMSIARGCIERKEIARQASLLHSCVQIIGELLGSLNMSEGGPLAQNLSNLYEYIINRLILANSQSDSAGVLEAASLLDEIRGAWFAIGAEVRNAPRVSAPAVVNAAVSPP